MDAQMIFRRVEVKYMLTAAQAARLQDVLREHMKPDRFAHSDIRNLYLDTDTHRLVRRSLEKPLYKEKLRVRSYGPAGETDEIFIELKKKFDGIVYKRRLAMPCGEMLDALESGAPLPAEGQIAREIEAFRAFYGPTLKPAMFIAYDRDSWQARDAGEDLRLTLDTNIRYRTEDLSLRTGFRDIRLTEPGQVLMELKAPGGLRLWMTRFLTEQKIRQVSFSKYGAAYCRLMTGNEEERNRETA